MIKAVFKSGVVQLLQPPPAEWVEGEALRVELSADSADDWTPDQIEAHYRELDALCATNEPADEAIIRFAVEERRRISKEQMRREMERSP